eukprot:6591974-Pyramimonas_sp.AAC.1
MVSGAGVEGQTGGPDPGATGERDDNDRVRGQPTQTGEDHWDSASWHGEPSWWHWGWWPSSWSL